MRKRGYSFSSERSDFISSLYFPLNVGRISGNTRVVTMAQTTIKPVAIKYISRHPNISPTIPLITREASIPVNRPETTSPTFRPLFSGFEYNAAIGMKICGITEQIPVKREAVRTMWILGANAMLSREMIRMEKFMMMIFFRWNMSPSGITNNSPIA